MAGSNIPISSDKNVSAFKTLAQGTNVLVLVASFVNLIVSLALAVVIFMGFQKDKNTPKFEDIAASLDRSSSNEESKTSSDIGSEKIKDDQTVNQDGSSRVEDKKNNVRFGKMLNLDQFTINLAAVSGVNPKFVRVNVSLEVADQDAEAELTAKMPQVRNAIIDLFNSKKSGDLSTVDGREAIKEDIKNALNGFMVNGKVNGVFFTSFAISS